MRWQSGRQSANVEDRRHMGGQMMIGGGIGTVVLVLIVMFLGGDPRALLQFAQQPAQQAQQPDDPRTAELKKFVSTVLADTEDVWREQFQRIGRQYREPKLVLFAGRVQSACGLAGSASGPFYCPTDEKVYLDLEFFDQLHRRFGAPGDFAQAYVIAHEIGHHVQKQLGYMDRVHQARGRVSEAEYNSLSVRLELQADFLAGVWAHHAQRTRQVLEEGDIEEALNAANAIGDDTLQKETHGHVVPDSFTHGTSAQRMRWFKKGFESGDIRQGDTFAADGL